MEKNKIEIESVSSPIFPPLRRRDIPRKESVVPFPKGIRGVDINRLSQDIRDVSWRGLWQVGGPISNSSSCLRDIYAHTNRLESMISWICIYVYTHARRENKREGKVGSTKSRPRQIGNRSLDSIWNATNPADRVYDNVKRWNDLVSFVVSLTREWYTALDENTTGEARNKLQGTNRGGPLGFSYRPINNWQRMAFCHLVYSIN